MTIAIEKISSPIIIFLLIVIYFNYKFSAFVFNHVNTFSDRFKFL
jgi:hypothetical protein